MPPLTAVMLLLKKGAKLEIYFISLRQCQDRPTQHYLPFARSAPTTNVVKQDLALPELFQANWAASSRHISAYNIFDAMMLKQMQGHLLV